ncbi:SLAIN motif-containing protein 2-like isoform X2 [Ptychodera flava]|uniref:SLAIN motif-containing protein 2-like isoform X2 n=1 Tax=Ptychodera flava TaxID=63121 RepID=UPI003969DC88
MGDTDSGADPEVQVKKLQDLVKKLERQNEQLRNRTNLESDMDVDTISTEEISKLAESDRDTFTKDFANLSIDAVEELNLESENEGDEDTWLYSSPSKPPTMEQRKVSPYKWARQDFDNPSKDMEKARISLYARIEEVSRLSRNYPPFVSPLGGVPSTTSPVVSPVTNIGTKVQQSSSAQASPVGGAVGASTGGSPRRERHQSAEEKLGINKLEDVTDVQIIARMQEESLRQATIQSSPNSSPRRISSPSSSLQYQQQQQQHHQKEPHHRSHPQLQQHRKHPQHQQQQHYQPQQQYHHDQLRNQAQLLQQHQQQQQHHRQQHSPLQFQPEQQYHRNHYEPEQHHRPQQHSPQQYRQHPQQQQLHQELLQHQSRKQHQRQHRQHGQQHHRRDRGHSPKHRQSDNDFVGDNYEHGQQTVVLRRRPSLERIKKNHEGDVKRYSLGASLTNHSVSPDDLTNLQVADQTRSSMPNLVRERGNRQQTSPPPPPPPQQNHDSRLRQPTQVSQLRQPSPTKLRAVSPHRSSIPVRSGDISPHRSSSLPRPVSRNGQKHKSRLGTPVNHSRSTSIPRQTTGEYRVRDESWKEGCF